MLAFTSHSAWFTAPVITTLLLAGSGFSNTASAQFNNSVCEAGEEEVTGLLSVSSATGGWGDPIADAQRLLDGSWDGWAPNYPTQASVTLTLAQTTAVSDLYVFSGGANGSVQVQINNSAAQTLNLTGNYSWQSTPVASNLSQLTLVRNNAGDNLVEIRLCSAGTVPDNPEPPIDEPPTDEPPTDEPPVNEPSTGMPRTNSAGALVTGQNSNLQTAIGFGNWSEEPGVKDTLSTACQELHDSYWIEGPDNKAYPTWHPAGVIHPETGEGCVFGHEHGDDPSKAPDWLFDYSGGWPAFGYAMEQLDGHRHEDHFGHKVTVTRFRAAIGNTANSGAAMYDAGFDCEFISKIHQGSHSEDAFSNHLHEYFLTVACDDDPGVTSNRKVRTLASIKTMLPYGAPDRFRNRCLSNQPEDNDLFYSANVLGFDGITTIMPAMQTFPIKPDIQLNDRGFACVNPSQGSFINANADYMDRLDLWHQIHSVSGPGNVSFEFNPYYIVKDVPRVHAVDRDSAGNRIGQGQVRYTIDECERFANLNLAFCEGSYINDSNQVHSPYSIHSPFKGALRAINFKSFNIYNNSSSRTSDAFCTDAYGEHNGAQIVNGQCSEGILQRISKGFDGNTNMWSWRNPQTGVTGAVTGAFEVYGQRVRYPNAAYARGESNQPFIFDHQRPNSSGHGCPRGPVSFPYQNSQHAYCPAGIGFERIIDHRNSVPDNVKNAVAINPATGQRYNTDLHAPN